MTRASIPLKLKEIELIRILKYLLTFTSGDGDTNGLCSNDCTAEVDDGKDDDIVLDGSSKPKSLK